ncbi:MAG: DNA ligase B [candidate division WS2 bacterium]|nr:DNA ligase B [Candidatus Lithacetigena glycinireducens]
MLFNDFSTYLKELEETTKRNQMVEILSRLFKIISPEEIEKAIYLLQGRLAPTFLPLEMGVSDKLCINAISSSLSLPKKIVNEWYKETGDLGEVAEKYISSSLNQMSVLDIHSSLLQIAQSSGEGAVSKKVEILSSLLSKSGGSEAKYIIRIVLGGLRLGVGDPTILDALSYTYGGNKNLRTLIERAYNLSSDLGLVAKEFIMHGPEGLKNFKISVGNPIRVALAERLSNGTEIVEKIGLCSIEPKFDGFRCQVHLKGDKVEIFSRNMENTTSMFPDLVEGLLVQVKANSCILEGEAVAYNPDTGEFYPFQMTAQRKRKYNIEEISTRFPLKLFAFDLLYLNGEDITEKSYVDRRFLLLKTISAGKTVEAIPAITTDCPGKIEEYLSSLLEQGLEGVIAKRLDTPYTAGARNFNWIKLKRSYKASLSDTIDAVLLGYYKGKGLRTRFGIGAMLVGVYDEDEDRFKTIGKIGTGPTDIEWVYFKEVMDKTSLAHKHPRVDADIEVDVWVEPKTVIVVQADEITRSPVHTCGKTNTEAGYALRFPRVLGLIRDDKKAEDATSVSEIRQLYQLQKRMFLK